jgi:hypothetical protein
MAVGADFRAALRAAGIIYYPLFFSNFAPLRRLFIFQGVDVSGGSFAAQLRMLPDAGGGALATLTCAASLVGADTHLVISASEATVEGLPAAAELGRNAEYHWDCEMTPTGEAKRKIFAGEAVRTAGVTQ